MGIRGARLELENGKTISVESEDDDFTGDLSGRDQNRLVRELKRKIRDEYDGESVELAKGARIVMYESTNSAKWSPLVLQTSPDDGTIADCTISVSQSALKKVLKGDFAPTSYLLDRPEISGDQQLAKNLGWILKSLI